MMTKINGFVAPGFEQVEAAFAQNFELGLEVGAAFAVYRGHEALVDIWAGNSDSRTGALWQKDTLQTIASGTKGLIGICMLMLIDRGLINLDDSVEQHWPEFGKPRVRIRDVVSHTARLPGVATTELTVEQFVDDAYMSQVMAREPQSNDPRAVFTYHPFTIGWICSELMRRVTGKSFSEFLQQELAIPLGLDLWVGLPEEQEARVAWTDVNELLGSSKQFGPIPTTDAKEDTLFWSQWWNPGILSSSTASGRNSRAFRAGSIPAANGTATARSVARLYAEVADGGGRLLSPGTLALASSAISDGWDTMQQRWRKHSVVFQLSTPDTWLGPSEHAFGHGGAGGSIHGAWPHNRVGFSYCMNLMRADEEGDLRTPRLLRALAQSLKR